MTMTISQASATIYTFPARGRFAAIAGQDQFVQAANVLVPRGVRIASGSGWYHDAAIQAEESRNS
jgi:Protein of unknown function (DUF2735)